MRYTYTITDNANKEEEVKAMSYKKAIKKVLILNAKFNGWISYFNKKGHLQTRYFRKGKETRK